MSLFFNTARLSMVLFVFTTTYIHGAQLMEIFGDRHGVPDPDGVCWLEYGKEGPKCKGGPCADARVEIMLVANDGTQRGTGKFVNIKRSCKYQDLPAPLIGCTCRWDR